MNAYHQEFLQRLKEQARDRIFVRAIIIRHHKNQNLFEIVYHLLTVKPNGEIFWVYYTVTHPLKNWGFFRARLNPIYVHESETDENKEGIFRVFSERYRDHNTEHIDQLDVVCCFRIGKEAITRIGILLDLVGIGEILIHTAVACAISDKISNNSTANDYSLLDERLHGLLEEEFRKISAATRNLSITTE
jgi:hypothetical protein